MIRKMLFVTTLAAIIFSACPYIKAADNPPGESYTKSRTSSYKFDFGPGKTEPGYIQITPSTVYSQELGYGFHSDSLLSYVMAIDRGSDDAIRSDFCSSTSPFFFTVDVPEGNYQVTVTMGDEKAETATTVKTELRRLMLEKVRTAPGEFATRTFLVNTRSPRIAGGGEVELKDREKTFEFWAWDDKLTFEFNDTRPTVCSLEIAPVDNTKTIFLLGDSTVCDQPREPFNSWGQMVTRFFTPEVVIANHSESGETFRDSQHRRRLDKILSLMKPGDVLIMQFGHNDMKERGEGISAFTSFKSSIKHFVAETRKAGGIPVLVTPVQRRNFDEQDKIVNSHGDYPEAVRQAAKEDNVPLIDLHAMSTTLYETLGPQGSVSLFSVPEDRTHHNNFGSYQLAKCIVQGIIDNKLDIAQYIVDDWQDFNPAHPDPLESWEFPASPQMTSLRPDGN